MLLYRSLLAEKPDVVVGTPSKVLALLQAKVCDSTPFFNVQANNIALQSLSLGGLESLVIDEADLIFSYGHDEDVRQILNNGYLPKVFQSFLMSATMTEDVETLKGLVLRSPVSSSIHPCSHPYHLTFVQRQF